MGPNFKSGASSKWYNNIVCDAPYGALAISGSAANGFYRNDATAEAGYDGSGTSVLNTGVSPFTTSATDTSSPSGPYGVIKGTVFYRCGLAYNGSSSSTPKSSINVTDKSTFAELFRSANTARESGNNQLATIKKIFGDDVEDVVANSVSGNTSAALANNNYANLNPGFTLPALSRIEAKSLDLTPEDVIGNNIIRNTGAVTIDRNLAPQLDQLTVAPFIGAARDNAWWMGWTMIGESGIFVDNQNAIAPTTVTITANASTPSRPVITFAAAPGVKYSIERSTDGKLFKSIAIETRSTSGNIEYTDTGATVSSTAVSYRVLAL
jgi:hypothetical protein